MLSGIKRGKKRKQSKSKKTSVDHYPTKEVTITSTNNNDNLSVAEQLRQTLMSGDKALNPLPSKVKNEPSVMEQLEKRGRIVSSNEKDIHDDNDIVLRGAALPADRPSYQKEDFRFGSRKGKLKREEMDVAGTTAVQSSMTIKQMVAEERNNKTSMDEQFSRNLARIGKRYKGTEWKQSSTSGADEDEQIDMKMFSSQRLTNVATQQRERSRQIAQHDKERTIKSRFWWWIESTSFNKQLLVALGNYVSLVLAPVNMSLDDAHCFLVPVKYAESFASCDDDVFDELKRFQTSLRNMFARDKKGVLFVETVLPSKGIWQTRMECIPVPKYIEQDASMYFKSALSEQAEEFGTHTKLLSTKNRGIRGTVPKHFPYFWIENDEDGSGYAQIIENENKDFPRDFGVDTIAGMQGLDPIRFRRKQKSPDHDRKRVLEFVKRWKAFDWTLDLD